MEQNSFVTWELSELPVLHLHWRVSYCLHPRGLFFSAEYWGCVTLVQVRRRWSTSLSGSVSGTGPVLPAHSALCHWWASASTPPVIASSVVTAIGRSELCRLRPLSCTGSAPWAALASVGSDLKLTNRPFPCSSLTTRSSAAPRLMLTQSTTSGMRWDAFQPHSCWSIGLNLHAHKQSEGDFRSCWFIHHFTLTLCEQYIPAPLKFLSFLSK